ncbi:uncharacterized protein LOC144152145 [Haemaphysalis longicornis]
MQGSSGAVNAAVPGRGNRFLAQDDCYQVSLPTLPTGRIVFNTVFLHGDMRARPYRVEDFRDTLARLELLPEVLALGAFQMSHVWAVTFKSELGVKKILEAKELHVKGRHCLVIDPANQDLRLKLHWLLYNVTEDDVRVALAPYGRVSEVPRERWRVQGVHDKGSTTRSVTLKLNAGVRAEDLPHQLRVAGEQALVVVPGRAPQCLRCSGTGHMRRDCKVPRCTLCRRFGHEANECVRTYAKVAGPVGDVDRTENIMDEEETEAAAAGGGGDPVTEDAPPEKSAEVKESAAVVVLPAQSVNEGDQLTYDGDGESPVSVAGQFAALETPAPQEGVDLKTGDQDQSVAKRPRQDSVGQRGGGDGSVAVGSVSVGPTSRRSSFKPKLNTPYDRGPTATKNS